MTPEHKTHMEPRIEHDSMGAMAVPADALYGAQTARAIVNFPISSLRPQRPFLRALGLIKAAAARVNGRHGWVEPARAAAIERAAMEVAEGRYDAQFAVDVFQTGSGTSTNMNANEVIAHLAGLDPAVHPAVHPNDEVNRGQSSNDVFPSAMHIAAVETATHRLLNALDLLERELSRKAREFHDVVKIGRTHLQDAVPMRLGQEFSGYARQVKNAIGRIVHAIDGLYQLPLGGTAVGTGLNAPPGFAAETIAEIARLTGLPFVEAENHFEAQAAKDAVVSLSGALRGCAVALTKIANDIRWLGSGPRCGLGELKIAGRAAGFEHHAGEGESGDRREPADGVRAGDWIRRHHRLVRRGGQFRAERDDARDGLGHRGIDYGPVRRLPELRTLPGRRTGGRPRARLEFCGAISRHGDGAGPGDWLRCRRGSGEERAFDRTYGARSGFGAERIECGAAV